MNDLISREEAIRLYCREHCGWEPEKCPLAYERDGTEECSFVRLLKELPSVQPEQKHGHWIVTDIPNLTSTVQDVVTFTRQCRCSECGAMFGRESDKYCYNCGARMEESE